MLKAFRRWLTYKPNHVATALYGGLGNQLFQFAAARALSHRLGVPLKLDYLEKPDAWGRQGNELRHINLAHARLTDLERTDWLGPGSTPTTQRWHCRWIDRRFLGRRVLESADTRALNLYSHPRAAYLVGHWQSECFFRDQADRIRDELLQGCRAYEPTDDNAPDSVAIHIRRGDYLEPSVRKVLGPCSINYYQKAIALIRNNIPNAKFTIFTDDPTFVLTEPNLARIGVVKNPHKNCPVIDLVHMSRSRHFIIANSTFSWWAAWLGHKPDSLVISPKPWFSSNSTTQSRITPENWVTMPKD